MQIPEVVIIDDDRDDAVTNGEFNYLQTPRIVVSAGPSNTISLQSDNPTTLLTNQSYAPPKREKNNAFWRSTSKDSAFSTVDDDEEEEELTRLTDQVMVQT